MSNIDKHYLEEAYSAIVGKPPGAAAAKQQIKPKKSKTTTFQSMSKGVKGIPVGNDKSTKGFVHKNSGPEGADNFKNTPIDPDNPDMSNDNYYGVNRFSDKDSQIKHKSKKISKENINTNMANNKSTFDRLYEEVMDDELEIKELGIGDNNDTGGEFGDEGGDEDNMVTITLDKELARQLHDALMSVVGGDDEISDEDGGEDDFGAEGGDDNGDEGGFPEEMEESEDGDDEAEEEEENFNYFGEEIEAEDLGTPLVNQKKGGSTAVKGSANVVHSSNTKSVGSKGGDSKVTNKTGDTTEGTPLVNQKKGGSTHVKGSGNVVKSKIKGGGKGDQEFFQKNS
jgi:hypothetical protein